MERLSLFHGLHLMNQGFGNYSMENPRTSNLVLKAPWLTTLSINTILVIYIIVFLMVLRYVLLLLPKLPFKGSLKILFMNDNLYGYELMI